MATTYITDEVLLEKVAGRLGTTGDKLTEESPWMEDVVADANQAAYQEIRSKLVGRGYAADQIDQWDRREEYNRRVGICFAFREIALLKTYDADALNHVCACLEELDGVTILIDGEPAELGGSAGVNFGIMTSPTDVFDPDNWGGYGCGGRDDRPA